MNNLETLVSYSSEIDISDFNIDSLIVNISYFVVETEDIVLL